MILFAATVYLLAQAHPADWKVRTFPGGFTVDSPSAFSWTPPEVKKGSSIVSDSWIAIEEVHDLFSVSVTWDKGQEDKTPPHQVLGQFCNAMTAGPKVIIRSQQDLALRGWPGIAVEYVDAYGEVTAFRAYCVKGKLFQAAAIRESIRSDASNANRFLYSMNIPASIGTGPQKAAGPEYAIYPLRGISLRLPTKPDKETKTVGPESQMGVLTRFTSVYGNRVYMCAVVDIPDEAMGDLDGHEQEILETLNSQVLGAMRAKDQNDIHTTLDMHDALSSSASVEKNFVAHVETCVAGQRIYSLITVTPRVLAKSPEVQAFFASAKLD